MAKPDFKPDLHPRDCADCENCPLRTYWQGKNAWDPVPFEHNEDMESPSGLLMLLDAPAKADVQSRRPATDHAGAFLTEALREAGLARLQVNWGTLVACRWPDDDFRKFNAWFEAENRRRARRDEPPLQHPVKACKPYVDQKLEAYETVIAIGDEAARAAIGSYKSLDNLRQGPWRTSRHKVQATWHPRDLRGRGELLPIVKSDIAKGVRHHHDRLRWKDPTLHHQPDPYAFQRWLLEGPEYVYWDVETERRDVLESHVYMIQIGSADEVFIFYLRPRAWPSGIEGYRGCLTQELRDSGLPGFTSDDGGEWVKPYSQANLSFLFDLFKIALTQHPTVGHNADTFDRMKIETFLGFTPNCAADTLPLHRLGASELPHSLGFVASQLLDVPAWKSDHAGVEARTDEELGTYGGTDVAVTGRVHGPLIKMAAARSQDHLVAYEAKMADLCVKMKRTGIRVDEARRAAHEAAQTRIAAEHLAALHSEIPGLNPNSHAQMRRLLFDDWGLPPQEFTKAGEASTNAATLKALELNPIATEEQRAIIKRVRKWKKATKLISGFLNRFKPGAGLVTPDGYAHMGYNPRGTKTGRLASGFQQLPSNLRDMFFPPPGCVFVDSDYDQLELRLIAALSGARLYLDALENNSIDPHCLTTELMYGEGIWSLPGAPAVKTGKGAKGSPFRLTRDSGKTIGFAGAYGAREPTILEIVRRVEDRQTGEMVFGHFTLPQIRVLRRRWLRNLPELERWWRDTIKTYRRQGYIAEPITGFRRYFAQEDYNAIINFAVQAGGFRIMAKAMFDLDALIPSDYAQHTGLVAQLHDAVTYAVPERDADYVRSVVTETMTRREGGLPITFTAEADIRTTWKEDT